MTFVMGMPRWPCRPGVDPKIVSERLGHSSVAFTLDCYSHAIPALEETAATPVANLVFEGADTASV